MLVYKVIVLQIPYDYKNKDIKEHLCGYFRKYEDMMEERSKAIKHFRDSDEYFYKVHVQNIMVKE